MKILVGINGDAESFSAAAAEKAGITFVTIPGEGVTKSKIASVLCRYARENGFDAAATGHYCRVVADEDGQSKDSVSVMLKPQYVKSLTKAIYCPVFPRKTLKCLFVL